MTLETFIKSPIYRRGVVKRGITVVKRGIALHDGWTARSFKEIRLDTSNLQDGIQPRYYYLNGDASRLVLVWIHYPKEDFIILKDFINDALTFTAKLIAENLPDIANVEHALNLFYSSETNEFIPQHCKVSRSKFNQNNT